MLVWSRSQNTGAPAMTKLTRRKALGVLAAPATLAATAPVAMAQQPAPSFTLLLVNDIYKMSDDKGRGGFARAAGSMDSAGEASSASAPPTLCSTWLGAMIQSGLAASAASAETGR